MESPSSPPTTERRQELARLLEECGAFNLRRTTRHVSQYFDEHLRAVGLKATQASILLALYIEQSVGLSELARKLSLSPSTLSRNLKPLERDGFVSSEGEPGRIRNVQLTEAGEQKIAEAIPLWQLAQQKFTQMIGETHWKELNTQLARAVQGLTS